MRGLYLSLALIGAALPYSQFIPWLAENGLNLPKLVDELLATRIGAFFGCDVLVSAVVLIGFIRREGAKRGIRFLWLPIAVTCVIGVSCGLPLFLYMRERRSAADT